MKLTLADAARYLRTSRASQPFLALFGQVKRVITFTHERANRLVRYVAIVRAYKNNVPVQTIVDEYGCSKSTVLRYARVAELPKRPKATTAASVRAEVIRLYKADVPIAEIARQCNVSQAYISKTATEEGINRRNFRKRVNA
jgi:DNA invertase Pin-like site-specific DNA recombinase